MMVGVRSRYVWRGTVASLFAALLAAFFFNETLGWRRMLGMAIAFAGVVIIAGEPRFDGNLWPLLTVIGAACIWSFCNVQIKKL